MSTGVGRSDKVSPSPDPAGRKQGVARRRNALPFALIAPSLVVLGLLLGYPLVRLATLSFQRFGLRQQFGAPAEWVGLRNFSTILSDPEFWNVLRRTVLFCFLNVVLTLAIGLAVALVMNRLGNRMRLLLTTGLLFAWAMPALTATVVWQWLFDTQYGLVNHLLTQAGADYQDHSWLSQPFSFYFVATVIVVWMAVPFVAFTLYAGMTQVPKELLEAAEIDGATAVQRFRAVMLPILRPVLLILTALSVLWDFRVFTQIYVLQRAGGINRETNVLGVYAYRISIGENRFDTGAAIAIVMVGITVLLTLVYLREMIRQEEL